MEDNKTPPFFRAWFLINFIEIYLIYSKYRGNAFEAKIIGSIFKGMIVAFALYVIDGIVEWQRSKSRC